MAFVSIVGLFAGLVTILAFMISLPTGAARVTAAVACAATAGVMWQAFRERITRTLVTWLVLMGLAVASLIFVLADGQETSDAPPAAGTEPREVNPDQQTSAPSTPSPTDRSSSPPPPTETLLLDQLQVAAGGDEWVRGEQILDGTTYDASLTAPDSGVQCAEPVPISYNLRREWTGFSATVGILDDAPNGSQASFSLDGDGKELYRTEDMGIGDQHVVEVNIEGVFRLTLQTNSNCDDYIGTWGSPTLSR
jgi:hypothetical protein